MRLGCGYIALVLLALECGLVSTQTLAGNAGDNNASFDFFPEVKSFDSSSQTPRPRIAKKAMPATHAQRKLPESIPAPKVYTFAEDNAPANTISRQPLIKTKKIAYKPVVKNFVPQPKAVVAVHSPVAHPAKKHAVLKIETNQPAAEQRIALEKIRNVKINLAAISNRSNVVQAVSDLKLKPALASMARINLHASHKNQEAKAKSADQVAPVKVNAIFGDRVDDKKVAAKTEKIKIMTTADAGVDPGKVKPAIAVRSMFVSPPKKTKALVAGRTTALPSLLPQSKPVSETQPAKQVAAVLQPQPKPQPEQKQDMPVAAVQTQPKTGMIDSSESDKQHAVKVFTGDMNRNELFILGEDDAVPEHLVENPGTEMAVLGGDMDEGSRKIMEFKLAALKVARDRAAKELAERQANAKALADIELEEKEAARQLAQAQKALEDMRKLKEWQKQKEKDVGKIAQDAGPAYKKAIVHAVVPENINVNAPAKKPKNTYVPIEQIALSVEKITDEMNGAAEVQDPASVAAPASNKVDASLERKDVAVTDKKNATGKKLARKQKRVLDVERVSAKQINQEVMKIKSGKSRQVSRKKSREKVAAVPSGIKVSAVPRSVIDYESDRVVVNSLS